MVTEKSTQAERVQTLRDIQREAARLAGEDAPQEIIFKDLSPGRKKVSIWRIADGREIQIPVYMLPQILGKLNADGTDIFTGRQSEAAEYKPGTTLCFLHADSPEQVILQEIGLTANPCPKSTLRNNHSKRMHAKHRHKQEWEAYEAYLDDQKEVEAVARQERQLDATLAIARGAAPAQRGTVVTGTSDSMVAAKDAREALTCDQCGQECKSKAGLMAHVRGAHDDVSE